MALKLKKKGVAAIEASAKGGGGGSVGKWVRFLRIKDKQDAWLQFVTPIEEWGQVPIHRFVAVPPREGSDREQDFEQFVCRKVDDEGDGSCVLCDEMGHEPDNYYASIVLQLEPVYDGKGKRVPNVESFNVKGRTVTRDDGTEVFYPAWELAYQAPGNFFKHLTVIDAKQAAVSDTAFYVSRSDKDYSFIPAMNAEAIDVSEYGERVPELIAVLEQLMDSERYDEYFGDPDNRLPQHQKYKGDKKGKANDNDDDSGEDEAPKKRPSQKSRLDRIREDLKEY